MENGQHVIICLIVFLFSSALNVINDTTLNSNYTISRTSMA